MATAAQSQSALSTRTQKKQVIVEVAGPSRREFLYYIWGASMALLLGGTGAGIVWFALPRFKEGEFGGIFPFDPLDLPDSSAPPLSVPAGRFWASNTDEGFLALYAVCTHLGCLPKWVELNNRFECPCHGSKFQKEGTYIAGPAPRSMDLFVATITFADGTTASNAAGQPIPLNGKEIVGIAVDTGNRVLGKSH
jgi:cytochrome b6-f complex iron-sulfur subunit